MTLQDLQQLEQVNDLVIAPVANVRPRVMRINYLPINTIARDAIRIVAVRSGGVDKAADHAGGKTRKRNSQRLPVLKNVPPVPLVVQDPRTIGITRGNEKAIPW